MTGENCRIQETGQIISESVEVDGRMCWCPNPWEYFFDFFSDEGPIAVCEPLTTSPPPPPTTPPTPPPPCVGDNGEVLEPGQQVMYSGWGSCKYCECDPREGLKCVYGDCLPAMCVDFFTPNGSCCPQCPNGQ